MILDMEKHAEKHARLQNYIDIVIESNGFQGRLTDSEKLDCIDDITNWRPISALSDLERYEAICLMLQQWRGE